jgi:hypothetical protein
MNGSGKIAEGGGASGRAAVRAEKSATFLLDLMRMRG